MFSHALVAVTTGLSRLALAVSSILLAWAAIRPVWAWRLRKLPGPRRLPLLGNLVDIIAHGNMTVWLDEQARKFGCVFTMWNGSKPVVVISDANLGRKLLSQYQARPDLNMFTLLVGEDHEFTRRGLFLMNPDTQGKKFRMMRRAFEMAVMHASALAAHADVLSQCASRLTQYLSRYATTGEPIDVTRPLSDMTMDAVGFAAFGLDFDCLGVARQSKANAATLDGVTAVTETNTAKLDATLSNDWWKGKPGTAEFGDGLVSCSRKIFRYGNITTGSPWKILSMLFPALYNITRHVATVFPDDRLKDEQQARRCLRLAMRTIVEEWKRQKTNNTAAAGDEGNGISKLHAISDRGFMAQLLSIMNEVHLDELDVMSEAFTMVLAGYETTASTLAAALHLLSVNPQAQARAHQELDDVLHGKKPAADDLEHLPYICGVMDEALRLYPPGDAAVRVMKPAEHDLDLGDGRVIPTGVQLYINLYALHHDPAVWPRVEEFLPERHMPDHPELAPKNPNAFMPFGYGSRKCVGFKFSLLEGRLALSRLLQAYSFAPAPGLPPTKWRKGLVFSADHVWLTISHRGDKKKLEA